MFAAFLKPVRREFLFTFIAVSIALAFGRWWAFDGGLWTWGGLIFSGLLFVDAGHNWPKLHALDVPARRWVGGALTTAALWSAVMAAIAAASALIMQRNSPYYTWYDWFVNTDGPVTHLDTNGAEYVLPDMGITAASVAWTYLILVSAFLIFTITGLAVGVSLRRWPQLLTMGISGVVALALLIAVTIYLSWTAYQRAENPDVVFPIMLESWQRFLLVLVVGAAPAIAGWWTIRRSLRNPWA